MKFYLTIAFIATTLFSFSQDPHLKQNVFYTTFESGVGVETKVTFSISKETISKIDSFPVFIDFLDKTFKNPENAEFLKRWKNLSKVELFLMEKTGTASFMAKLNLKNGTSYTPIENSKGNIFFMPDGKKMIISFPFKAQNGRGDLIFSKCMYSISWDGKKEVNDTFVD